VILARDVGQRVFLLCFGLPRLTDQNLIRLEREGLGIGRLTHQQCRQPPCAHRSLASINIE
jgi:hypothetical protein